MTVERTPVEWAVLPLKRYAQFSGRSARAEYWWYVLATTLIGMVLEYVDEMVGKPVVGIYGPVSLIFTLGLVVPGLSVQVRRLHDIGRSGWWALLGASSYVLLLGGFIAENPEELFGVYQGMGTGPLLALIVAWLITIIVMLVFMVTRGDEGGNRFGPDPYEPDQLERIFA